MSKEKAEHGFPYLSRVKAFQSALLINGAPSVVRLEHARINKSEVGVANELVDGDLPAKPVKNDAQYGHEDSETDTYQSDLERESFEALPFCVAEVCHCAG